MQLDSKYACLNYLYASDSNIWDIKAVMKHLKNAYIDSCLKEKTWD